MRRLVLGMVGVLAAGGAGGQTPKTTNNPWAAPQSTLIRVRSDVALDARFSPDFEYLVTADDKKNVQFWDPETGKEKRAGGSAFDGTPEGTVIGFTADGACLICTEPVEGGYKSYILYLKAWRRTGTGGGARRAWWRSA